MSESKQILIKNIKQFLKEGFKPIAYILIGLFIGLAIYSVQAIVTPPVTNGTPLTVNLWEQVRTDLLNLENQFNNCRICIRCQEGGRTNGGTEQCTTINGGYSARTGDLTVNASPGSDNANCQVQMTCP